MADRRCTAPVRGHHTRASAVACPVHREEALGEAARVIETAHIETIQPVERRALAASADTAPSMLELLASDDGRAVRLLVARNPSTPVPTLLELREDADPAVAQVASARLSAASSPQLEPSRPS